MKIFISLILSLAMALLPLRAVYYYASASAGGAATYLRDQNFEGTGYDNSETWTTSTGSPNADYTTTVLVGSQSLFLNTAAANTRVRTDFTNASDMWFYCQFRLVGSAPAGIRKLAGFAANGSSTENYEVWINASSQMFVYHGATQSSATSTALSYGTTYHMWAHFVKGTGADGVASVGFSTDGTKPTSGNQFTSTASGAGTTDLGRMYLGYTSATTFDMIFDHVLIDDASIGNNP